ncbi:MAG TPA: magnesium chelatase, partial [Flavobacteriaceae bacterium]|nr:magnesium chelatase [Flavobacteriaceae bacterium]
ENLLSTAERRALQNGEEKTSVRLSDFMGIIPAITGKVELVYEGEQEGASEVAEQLINSAVKSQFENYFPKIEKLHKESDVDPYANVVAWFFEESG